MILLAYYAHCAYLQFETPCFFVRIKINQYDNRLHNLHSHPPIKSASQVTAGQTGWPNWGGGGIPPRLRGSSLMFLHRSSSSYSVETSGRRRLRVEQSTTSKSICESGQHGLIRNFRYPMHCRSHIIVHMLSVSALHRQTYGFVFFLCGFRWQMRI